MHTANIKIANGKNLSENYLNSGRNMDLNFTLKFSLLDNINN